MTRAGFTRHVPGKNTNDRWREHQNKTDDVATVNRVVAINLPREGRVPKRASIGRIKWQTLTSQFALKAKGQELRYEYKMEEGLTATKKRS